MSHRGIEPEASILTGSFLRNRIAKKTADVVTKNEVSFRSQSTGTNGLLDTTKHTSNPSNFLPTLNNVSVSPERNVIPISPVKSELRSNNLKKMYVAKNVSYNVFNIDDHEVDSTSLYRKFETGFQRKQKKVMRNLRNSPCRIQSQLSKAYMEELEQIQRSPMNIFHRRNRSIEEATKREKYVLPSPRGDEFKYKISKELEGIKLRAKERYYSSIPRTTGRKVMQYELDIANLESSTLNKTFDDASTLQASFFNEKPIPKLNLSMLSPETDSVQLNGSIGERKRRDPFEKTIVVFLYVKMPFKMALLARTRRKMVEEIKINSVNEKYPISSLVQTVKKYSPREQRKFLDERRNLSFVLTLVEVEEKKKKNKELLKRDPVSNAYYNLVTLDKRTKGRAITKLEQCLPFNSRYLI